MVGAPLISRLVPSNDSPGTAVIIDGVSEYDSAPLPSRASGRVSETGWPCWKVSASAIAPVPKVGRVSAVVSSMVMAMAEERLCKPEKPAREEVWVKVISPAESAMSSSSSANTLYGSASFQLSAVKSTLPLKPPSAMPGPPRRAPETLASKPMSTVTTSFSLASGALASRSVKAPASPSVSASVGGNASGLNLFTMRTVKVKLSLSAGVEASSALYLRVYNCSAACGVPLRVRLVSANAKPLGSPAPLGTDSRV